MFAGLNGHFLKNRFDTMADPGKCSKTRLLTCSLANLADTFKLKKDADFGLQNWIFSHILTQMEALIWISKQKIWKILCVKLGINEPSG